ncbi:MAG TPA: hypothetical protein VFE23_03725 [Usitatibacter sp.]|nr:hypothetical protein [Usitatibacter sp.]
MGEPLDPVFDALRELGAGADLRLRQAGEVAQAYAHVLRRASAERGDIGDVEELPFAKEAIRHALLMLLAAWTAPRLREPLRLAYIRLADWQPASPPLEPVDLRSWRATRDPLAMASRLAAGRAPAAERRRAAAVQERAQLVEELRRRGFA